MSSALLQRVVRRETHSPRTVASVVILAVIVLTAIYLGVEIILHLLGLRPLLVAPGSALAWPLGLPGHPKGMVVTGGVLAAVAGVVLVGLALSPGRRAKHELGASSYPVIVDNGVIASAIAERVRRELDLSRGSVIVGIGHRSADITVRPEPGQTVEPSQVRAAAESELSVYQLTPRVNVRARILRPADGEST